MSKPHKSPVATLLADDDDLPVANLDLSHAMTSAPTLASTTTTAVNLTSTAKVLLALGQGGTGKTTLLRWIADRMTTREDGDMMLATVDPINRELLQYYPAALSPQTQDPAKIAEWLEKALVALMRRKQSAAIDFGGGDTSLQRLVTEVPDLHAMLVGAGVHPVCFYMLSPRETDITPLALMQQAGFRPEATALMLNLGRADLTRDPELEFRQLRRQPAYRAALDAGAVEIWMPRLYAAKPIEDRRITFQQALTGQMPDGRPGLGPFDRSRLHHWLKAMDEAFAGVTSWLP
ncbi:MAG: hypothetical protein JSS43_16090 [Proteobacteria bacterium]|nr:hypothetical protein [Pseudomonadota bacterium]